jgi:pimeloyl-ACP methyl ester carboxylesterase
VTVAGRAGGLTLVFAHGFGCDQAMWRWVSPAFECDHQVVLFDHVGAGGSDLTEWSPDRYASLEGYARDVVEICEDLDLRSEPAQSPYAASVCRVVWRGGALVGGIPDLMPERGARPSALKACWPIWSSHPDGRRASSGRR